ncbi:MAG: tRNA (adenosine(37)-N6)-threonylcarbamoyltransferase complex dimerization subunit type 1 TsaB [Bacillota bacterium]|nr:tRNA (adenosine(37)-N6)-threonylcarbamoyltransferase complex dimerization subunit type 1 TsaB [Bacillota bacterium]
MKLLAIDTSATALSAAIVGEKGLLGEYALNIGKNHSLGLLPMLDSLLKNCGLQLADMDAFAVCIGPGSFTGLRIGLATAKAWGDAPDRH